MSGIDHLVLAVGDLEAARRRYAALGFTLTPPARHPFGTGNSLVQLEGAFLELLGVVAPEDIPQAAPGQFNFAAFNRDYLARGEGFSMLVLASEDARGEQVRMRAAGLESYSPFDFSRQARLPSGEEVTVGFSLAFATDAAMPDAAFFYCQQHAPEHFWKREYQRHANGAEAVEEVGLVAERPHEAGPFLAAFADTAAIATEGGLAIDTGRGTISVRNPDAFRAHWGFAPESAHEGPRLAGFRLGVSDGGAALKAVEASGVTAVIEDGRAIVAPRDLFGTGLVLAPRGRT
jgi:catechol 2,3-dioxygenase-like lactoylglutathione lyase family enzyme